MQRHIPSPLAIALGLTLFTAILVWFISPEAITLATLSNSWYKGFWELLGFSMQMVLILVLGHALALSPAAQALIDKLASAPKSSTQAVIMAAAFTMLAGLLNWGLGLIFGAILASSIGTEFKAKGKTLNYPLLVAASYTGMMVWHAGLSGSAPLKIANASHFLEEKIGVIPVNRTLFTCENFGVNLLVITGTLVGLYFIGRSHKKSTLLNNAPDKITTPTTQARVSYFSKAVGFLVLAYAIYRHFSGWQAIDLNYINLVLFGLVFLAHSNLNQLGNAVQVATGGASGIIMQFPLYAGIMGMLKYTGTLESLSANLITSASTSTLPYLTFISAGLINLLVPSGGGQWAVQGPVIMEAALQLKVAVEPIVMALAYGDGLTNMLQPFWALPLLGITRLEAKDIASYCFKIFLIGFLLYSLGILLFY